jgi:hypothetical protein
MSMSAKIAVVEIDSPDVRIAVVKTGGKLPTVIETHSARADFNDPEDQPEAMAVAVAEIVAAVNGPVSAWVLYTSSLYGVVRTLRIPFKGKSKVSAVVPGELEPFLAMPIEELIVDHVQVREFEGQTDVLAVAMRRDALEEPVALLEEAGVSIDGITIDVAATMSLWRCHQKNVNGTEAVLHVGETGSIFAIARPKSMAWFRHVSLTAEQLAEDPDSAVQTVQNSVRAFLANFEGEDTISALTITGAPYSEGAQAAFDDGLEIPAAFTDLGAGIKGLEDGDFPVLHIDEFPPEGEGEDGESPPAAIPSSSGDFTQLAGAAVSVAGGAYAFNFLKDNIASVSAVKGIKSHLIFTCALGIIALAGYGAYCYADYSRNVRIVDSTGEEIWRIYQELSTETEIARPLNDEGGTETLKLLRILDETSNAGSSPFGDLRLEWFSKRQVLDVLLEISAAYPDDKARVTNVIVNLSDKRTSDGIDTVVEIKMTVEASMANRSFVSKAENKLREESGMNVGSTFKQDGDIVTYTVTVTY